MIYAAAVDTAVVLIWDFGDRYGAVSAHIHSAAVFSDVLENRGGGNIECLSGVEVDGKAAAVAAGGIAGDLGTGDLRGAPDGEATAARSGGITRDVALLDDEFAEEPTPAPFPAEFPE